MASNYCGMILALTVSVSILSGVMCDVELYSSGTSADVMTLEHGDDNGYRANLTFGYIFFGQHYDIIYVNNNGNLSPKPGFQIKHTPTEMNLNTSQPLIAVFWSDVDTRNNAGSVMFWETNNAVLLQQAMEDVQRAYPAVSNIDYLFIATWDSVGYYNNMKDKLNTFQCVLAVSGNQTFVIYLYDDIQWSREGKAFAGYISGDGRTIFEIDGSFNTSIEEIESTTNVGKPGLWVFRVDDPVYLSCQDSATGITEISFESAYYTLSENNEQVEVCLYTSNDISYSFTLCLDIMSNSTQATVREDFTISPHFVVLRPGEKSVCVNQTVVKDSVIEGDEKAVLVVSTNNPSIALNGAPRQLAQIEVVITDETALLLNFTKSSYEVRLSNGTVNICLEAVGLAQIAPGVRVPVQLMAMSANHQDGTASKLLSDQLQFDRENNKDCIASNIFDYIDRQSDQTIRLQVKSGDSQFKVSGNEATVAVVNEEDQRCPPNEDDRGLMWPSTKPGMTRTQPCPGEDVTGNATRRCVQNQTWGDTDVLKCQSQAILKVVERAQKSLPPAHAMLDTVTMDQVDAAVTVSEELAVATMRGLETGLFPSDLNSTNNVVEQVLNVLEASQEGGQTNSISADVLLDVFNNVLDEANEDGWDQLQTETSGSQTLLRSAERYGAYIAKTIKNTADPVLLVRTNIVISAEVMNTANLSNVVFPANPDQLGNFSQELNETVKIEIPAESLRLLSAGDEGAGIYVVHIVFRNIQDFLPENGTGLINSSAVSLVISSQVGRLDRASIPKDIFSEHTVSLNFTFNDISDVEFNRYVGMFWNFSEPMGWSSEGIEVISNMTKDNVTTVQCSSTHLTSFAVLVGVGDGQEMPEQEDLALTIITYIGCAISGFCLIITVVYFLSMGKKLFSAIHYFVHLNLAISLLLGYIVFVTGIQFGTHNEIVCRFVAALLQYLFLCAFCWMLCEGITLYLMLVVVFSRVSKKWWLFLLLGYCTPFLFVITGLAVRTKQYGVQEGGKLAYCWLSTEHWTIFAFVAPMILIIIINTVFLVLALVQLIRIRKHKAKALLEEEKSTKKVLVILKGTVILLPLLGLTWLFGLLTISRETTVFAWLFTIFNTLQGAAIFFFHVVRSKAVWEKITRKFSQVKNVAFKTTSKNSTGSTTCAGSEGQSSSDKFKGLLNKNGKESPPVTECEMKANLGREGNQPHSENSLSINGGNVKTTENLYSCV